MNHSMFNPRAISPVPLSDADLARGISFEFANLAAAGTPSPRTCNFSFTKMCDGDGLGHTCTYGWTFRRDARQGPGRR